MATKRSFFYRHPVIVYYVLTFAISWGAIFIALSTNGIPTTRLQFNTVLPVAIFSMLLGPSMVAILLTAIIDGKTGFRDLWARLTKKHISGCWLVVALLLGPLLIVLSQIVFSWVTPGFPPTLFVNTDKGSLLLMGITSGVVAGFLEELGWTGFVMPRLRERFNILSTGLIMGVLWGSWHIASNAVMASGLYSAPLSPNLYIITRGLALAFGGLVAFRVLMVWVYDRTESLLVVMLMHLSYTAFTIILEPFEISGMPLLTLDVISTVVLWIVIAVIAMRNGFRLERKGSSQTG